MIWVILFAIVFIGLAVLQGNSNIDSFEKQFNCKNSDRLHSGTYISGHPDINESKKDTSLLLSNNDVKIIFVDANGFKLLGTIPKESISNVSMEDSSTIQSRVGVKRLLAVGIFAFAWKKKEKIECAYLVIEWKKGSFDMETLFEFEGNGSINRANTLRNTFINYLS